MSGREREDENRYDGALPSNDLRLSLDLRITRFAEPRRGLWRLEVSGAERLRFHKHRFLRHEFACFLDLELV